MNHAPTLQTVTSATFAEILLLRSVFISFSCGTVRTSCSVPTSEVGSDVQRKARLLIVTAVSAISGYVLSKLAKRNGAVYYSRPSITRAQRPQMSGHCLLEPISDRQFQQRGHFSQPARDTSTVT